MISHTVIIFHTFKQADKKQAGFILCLTNIHWLSFEHSTSFLIFDSLHQVVNFPYTEVKVFRSHYASL